MVLFEVRLFAQKIMKFLINNACRFNLWHEWQLALSPNQRKIYIMILYYRLTKMILGKEIHMYMLTI